MSDTFCVFIHMQKASDWIGHDLLFYKLLKYKSMEIFTDV